MFCCASSATFAVEEAESWRRTVASTMDELEEERHEEVFTALLLVAVSRAHCNFDAVMT